MTYVRTVRTHLEIAKHARALREAITSLNSQVFGRFPVAHPVQRMLAQLNAQAGKLTSNLDGDFHDIADEEDARRHGNIYYLREERVTEEAADDETEAIPERLTKLLIRVPKDPPL